MCKGWEYKLSGRDPRKYVFHKILCYRGIFSIKLKITVILVYSSDIKTIELYRSIFVMVYFVI